MDYERIQNSASLAELLQGMDGWRLPANSDSGLYIFAGLGRALYVGISRDPVFRVHQHLGLAGPWDYHARPRFDSASMIGRVVHIFSPESLDWRVYFPSAKEVASYVNAHPRVAFSDFEEDYRVFAIAERHLIYDLKCPVNKTYSREDVDESAFWELVWQKEGCPEQNPGDYLNL